MHRALVLGLVVFASLPLAACGGSSDTSGGGASSPSSGAGADDPYAAARAACLAEINKLREAKGLTDYARWQSAESCVDGEATSDEMTMMPHNAWLTDGDSCMGNAQNECEGQGASGIGGCIDEMWDESQQSACSGCDACADAYTSDCANCDFDGTQTGMVCGHYVNLSAHYLSQVACGFSSLGGWDAMNFE
jgi:hypothetical protein